MIKSNPWLLPVGIVELLPGQAEPLERMRRDILDLFAVWGYELVMPPFIEFLDSLLTGTGKDLDTQTFKLTDQVTGHLMGIRTDMTPQVARIDAHHLQRNTPVRLCYLGTVLRTLPDGFGSSRSPLQVGAELYGHSGIASDLEILQLMLATLRLSGMKDIHLDLGHVGIYRGLARQLGLSATQEDLLFDALQRKARTEVDTIVAQLDMDAAGKGMLAGLVDLNGGDEVQAQSRKLLAGASDAVLQALDELFSLGQQLKRLDDEVEVNYDVAELRGYQYQTGTVFAAYVPGYGQEVARGGRYDDIGKDFGRARPATGFSSDLKILMDLGQVSAYERDAIFAPADTDETLQASVEQLRSQGECVIRGLPGQTGAAAEMGCSRQLAKTADGWQVQSV